MYNCKSSTFCSNLAKLEPSFANWNRVRKCWSVPDPDLYIREQKRISALQHCLLHIEEEEDRREGRGRRCCFGDGMDSIPYAAQQI